MKCRFCAHEIQHEFIDIGHAPVSNAYLNGDQLGEPEIYYPLKVLVCDRCFLVQIDEYHKSDELFNAEYAYFSSMSSSWVAHAKNYVEMIIQKQNLSTRSKVIEIASNDGYLLQFFQAKGIPNLGIEPTKSTADAAREKGIEVVEKFFGSKLASTLPKADLILGNNVLAHVPDINDFVQGLKIALKPEGIITMEFPHVLNLILFSQFDTIYHEHFSYLSLIAVRSVFNTHGLLIYDVEELPTHGGSLRIYATHAENGYAVSSRVDDVLRQESMIHLDSLDGYTGFQQKANAIKYDFLHFLLETKCRNETVAAYGAAAKGNTFLNYCGIKNDLIEFVVDRAPMKIGKFLPGSHIPIVCEEKIREMKPQYVIIFPWNIKDEIIQQLSYIREWHGKFVVAVPTLEIL